MILYLAKVKGGLCEFVNTGYEELEIVQEEKHPQHKFQDLQIMDTTEQTDREVLCFS